MNEVYGYFINRYWIVEYIQYLQEWGAVQEYSSQPEDSDSPKGTIPYPFGATSFECTALWKDANLALSRWLSYKELFSAEGCDVLQLAMRWIDPIN